MSSSSTKWNYDSYAAIPADGLRHEIIDGTHYVNSSPNLYHQTLSRRIQYQLYTAIELTGLGLVFNAPVDVLFSDYDIVQPDLVVVLTSNSAILKPANIVGVPDLTVEILSPTSGLHDRIRKRNLYEMSGVPEYWILDPDRHRVTQHTLIEGQYQSIEQAARIRMQRAPFTEVDLQKVW